MADERDSNRKRKNEENDESRTYWRNIVDNPAAFAALATAVTAGGLLLTSPEFLHQYGRVVGRSVASYIVLTGANAVRYKLAAGPFAIGVGTSIAVGLAVYAGMYAVNRYCKRQRPNQASRDNSDTELKSIQTVRDFPKEFKQVCNMSISAIPPDADRDELTLVFTRFIGEMKGTQRDRACFVFSSLYRGRLIWLIQNQLVTEEGKCRVTPAADGDFLIHKNTKPSVRRLVNYTEIAGDEAEDIVRNFKNADDARTCNWQLRPQPFFTHVDDSRQ